MTPDEIVQAEMILGFELDEWQRGFLERLPLTPGAAARTILTPPRRLS